MPIDSSRLPSKAYWCSLWQLSRFVKDIQSEVMSSRVQCSLRRFGTNWCWICRCGKDQQLLVLDLRPRTRTRALGVCVILFQPSHDKSSSQWLRTLRNQLFIQCLSCFLRSRSLDLKPGSHSLILCKLPIVLCWLSFADLSSLICHSLASKTSHLHSFFILFLRPPHSSGPPDSSKPTQPFGRKAAYANKCNGGGFESSWDLEQFRAAASGDPPGGPTGTASHIFCAHRFRFSQTMMAAAWFSATSTMFMEFDACWQREWHGSSNCLHKRA